MVSSPLLLPPPGRAFFARSAAALVLLQALLAGSTVAQTAPPPVSVATVLVAPGGLVEALSIEGTLQPRQQSTVAAQVPGTVLQRLVNAGDRVRAGQVLARLDARDLQAGLAGGDAAVAQAAAALAQARLEVQRTRELRQQGFLSQAALDAALTRLQSAEAAQQQASANRNQAALARSFATATAPFDAVVLATHVETGDLAAPGRPLVTLYAPGRLRAVVQLPLSRTATARRASRVQVLLPDGRLVTPEQRTELPVADAVAQTVEWRLDLPADAVSGLQPGQPVQVRFSAEAAAPPTPAGAERLVVPAAAVLQRGELTAVYAAQGERFVLKAVRLGARQGEQVQVLTGLRPGERIALDPIRAGLTGAVPAAR